MRWVHIDHRFKTLQGRWHNVSTADTNGCGTGQSSICTTEAVLDNYLTGLLFYSHPCFFPWDASFSYTINT